MFGVYKLYCCSLRMHVVGLKFNILATCVCNSNNAHVQGLTSCIYKLQQLRVRVQHACIQSMEIGSGPWVHMSCPVNVKLVISNFEWMG